AYFIGKVSGAARDTTGRIVSYNHLGNCLFRIDKMEDYLLKIRDIFSSMNMEVYDEMAKLTNEVNNLVDYQSLAFYLDTYPQNSADNLLIFSPSEIESQFKSNAANTAPFRQTVQPTLHSAQKYFTKFPYYHELTFESLQELWSLIIFQVKKREQELLKFYKLDENKDKTLRIIDEKFNELHPEYLREIASKWNIILEDAGLYFDYENASIPTQLSESIITYFKTIKDKKVIEYHLLSSGIKHLLFRIGYLNSLFYRRNVNSAIILIDEPETSLFPDLLLKIVDNYINIFPQGQYYFATHSPIIASQFEPDERVILELDDDFKTICKRGLSPSGDDPNDILVSDFGLTNLLGKEGRKAFDRFLELKTLISRETDDEVKEDLINEFMSIGNKYKFGVNATNH
ncbi:MAG: AAA family ATPase, partial [Bacteroidia bacterium]|nr:AAA family ATPase [Bacteroidia bacterium]